MDFEEYISDTRSAKFELNPIKRCGPGALNVLPFQCNFCFELQAKMYCASIDLKSAKLFVAPALQMEILYF